MSDKVAQQPLSVLI